MYFLHQIRGQGRVCATANKIDGTQNNLIRETPIPQRFSTKCCITHFFVSLKNGRCVRVRPLNPKNAKNEKFQFFIFGVRTHWIFSNGKSAPFMLFREKPNECLRVTTPHKNFKTFPP